MTVHLLCFPEKTEIPSYCVRMQNLYKQPILKTGACISNQLPDFPEVKQICLIICLSLLLSSSEASVMPPAIQQQAPKRVGRKFGQTHSGTRRLPARGWFWCAAAAALQQTL